MRTIRLFGLFALGLVAACEVEDHPIPGEDSETAEVFEEVSDRLYGRLPETPREALEVLDHAVDEVSPGSHANLNAAAVALDNGEDDKAIDHLGHFKDKVDKERGKKVAEDDADFMNFVADSIIDGINEGGGG